MFDAKRSIDVANGCLLTISEGARSVSLWNETSAYIISSLADESAEEIAARLSAHFKLPKAKTLADVIATVEAFKAQNSSNLETETIAKFTLEINDNVFPSYLNIDGTIFEIYAPQHVLDMLIPLWAHKLHGRSPHCETIKIQTVDDQNGRLLLNGVEKIDSAPIHVLLGGAYQQIVETLNPELKWCAFIHAASVSLNGNGVILAAQSGSGKSTLTAMLVAHGYQYHSDDMVPLTLQSNRIASFPLPISVKAGAVKTLAPLFKCLDAAETVKTQHIIQDACFVGEMPKAKALVFPKYVKDATTQFEDISVSDALAKLFEDRIHFGYPVEPERVQNFVDWLSTIPRKTLVYSKFEEAEKCLSNLLQD